jgi:uncharacterized damage-inducible protein DinB
MGEIQRIVDQLRHAQEGGAWHGPSLAEALVGVTAAQAAAHPVRGGHSIWELVHHITAWEDVVSRRIGGESVHIPLGDPRDWPAVTDSGEAAWQAALARLREGHLRLRDAIARLDDARLDDPAPHKRNSLYGEIHGIIQHDLYHAGQISLLKKAL